MITFVIPNTNFSYFFSYRIIKFNGVQNQLARTFGKGLINIKKLKLRNTTTHTKISNLKYLITHQDKSYHKVM